MEGRKNRDDREGIKNMLKHDTLKDETLNTHIELLAKAKNNVLHDYRTSKWALSIFYVLVEHWLLIWGWRALYQNLGYKAQIC